jgi:hypothetical protein
MVKHMLPDTPIRKVQMRFYENSDFNLQGLRFFDEKDALIFEIGKHESNRMQEVLLAEDERIIGFISRGSGSGAFHFDFQLMIAKLF